MNQDWIHPDSGPSPEQLAAFLDGELDSAKRVRIETWLADHPADAEEIEGQRQVMRVWQANAPTEPSPAAWAAVYDGVQEKLRPVSPRRSNRVRRTIWLTAALAASVLIAALLSRQFQPDSARPKAPVIGSADFSAIATEAGDQEPILLAGQDDVSVVNVESYAKDDGRVPSIGEGDVSMIVAAPLAADR